MADIATDTNVEIFKKVYGNKFDLVTPDEEIGQSIPFSSAEKVGAEFVEAFLLTNEVGITFAGTDIGEVSFEESQTGVVKQSSVKPYQTYLTSKIPIPFFTRSVGAGDKAFAPGLELIMQNHIKSHHAFQEDARIHGQSATLLGAVSFAPSGTVHPRSAGTTYTGDGTITVGGVAFTNGVNTSAKKILIQPGELAAGIWVGREGAEIEQIVMSGMTVAASGLLVSVDVNLGILTVDFTPVVATGISSHCLGFKYWHEDKEMIGIEKILANTGTLFGISASTYSLWKSQTMALGGKKLNLKALQLAVARLKNAGGLKAKKLNVWVNSETFAGLTQDEAALRKYDSSYAKKAENGFDEIVYNCAGVALNIRESRKVKEGHCLLLTEDWVRSGSCEVTMNPPGINKEMVYQIPMKNVYAVHSYSDQYIICRKPACQMLITGIDNEGVAF